MSSGLSWVQAFLRAKARDCGWYLATITSSAENFFVFGLVRSRPELFIGSAGPWLGAFQTSSRAEPAGGWRWVTDESFGFTAWSFGQPDNRVAGGAPTLEPGISAGQNEGFLHYASNGTWNDLNVSAQPRGYVVEFDSARRSRCLP